MPYDLRLSDVGKRYRVSRPDARRRWRDVLRPQLGDFWALRHVSFDVAPGEVLGVIGPNGAGKSTLLKLLSSITAPTEGEIRIRGRLAALIEVGSGFHPELTGRENVFLSGTILGLRRRDIAARLDGIVQFAGIGEFLDVPVKWYSSGMYVRLGFAVAAQLEPDVLLVDEVLAVGDAAFQARCIQRILDLRRRGTTIVFISHDLGTVERLCDRVLLLQAGRVVADGQARDVVTMYQRSATASADQPAGAGEAHEGPAAITGLAVLAADGTERLVARSGEAISLEIGLRIQHGCPPVVAQVMVYSYDEGTLLFECVTAEDGLVLDPGDATVRFDLDALTLLPGRYTLGATVRRAGVTRAMDWWFGRTTLHVEEGPTGRGHVYVHYRWSVTAASGEGRRRYTSVQPSS